MPLRNNVQKEHILYVVQFYKLITCSKGDYVNEFADLGYVIEKDCQTSPFIGEVFHVKSYFLMWEIVKGVRL